MIAERDGRSADRFPFEQIEPLGSGSTGEVWRCRDPQHGLIAVKLVHDALDVAARERLRREHHVLASVHHPNVVRVLGLHESPRLALAMELVDGRPLVEALDDGRELDRDERVDRWRVDRLVALLRQLLDALDAIHASGLVHRDVKPDNALVTNRGSLKLLDLGLANETFRAIVGTPLYMAPEALAMQEVDGRADLYAVGAIGFQALTGLTPFEESRDFAAFTAARIGRDPLEPRHVHPAIPDDVSAAIGAMIARSPADRPATARAAARLLQHSRTEQKRKSTTIAIRATPAEVVEPPFIGRADPMTTLTLCAGTALGGDGSKAVTVVGEAGVGKTSLVSAWLTSLAREVLVLRVDCASEAVPLAAFASPLEELVFALAGLDAMAALGVVPPGVACLEGLTARVRELPGFDLQPPILAVEADEEDGRRTDILRSLIVNVARTRPIVLVAEELDGATEATRRAVSRIATSADARLLTVVTARELDEAAAADLGRDGVVAVSPFDENQMRALVAGALDATPAAELSAWVWDASAGNPRRAMDALRAAARLGAIVRADHPQRGGSVDLAPGRRERLLDSALASSALDGLPAEVLSVGAAVAVLGPGCRFDEVVAVSRRPHDVTARAVQRLLAARIVRELGAGLAFRAEALRRAAAASLDDGERRALHRRAATAIERGGGVDADARSVKHWLRAGETGRAMRRLPQAADALRLRGDRQEAHRMLTAGLTHLAGRSRTSPKQEALLHILRSSVSNVIGEPEQADADLAAAERLLARGRPHDERLERRLLDAMWDRHRTRGDYSTLKPRLERYLDAARERQDRVAEAFAHERLLQVLGALGDNDRAEAHGHRAVALFLALRDRSRLVSALNGLANVCANRRDIQQAVHYLKRALRVTRFLGLTSLETTLLQNLGAMLGGLGRQLEGMHALRETVAVARRIGDVAREATATLNLGSTRIMMGEYADGLRDLDRAEELLRATNHVRALVFVALNRAVAELGIGNTADAITALDRAIEELRTAGLGQGYLPTALFARAEAKLRLGDTGGARRDVDRARTEFASGPTETEGQLIEGRILLAEGRPIEAVAAVSRAIEEAAQANDLALVAQARAVLARATDDLAPAEIALSEAVDAGNPLVELEARATLVHILERGDDAERARTERERAMELCERIAAQCGDARETFLARPDLRLLLSLEPSDHAASATTVTSDDRVSERVARVVSWLTLVMVAVGAYNAIIRKLNPEWSSNRYLELQWYLFSLVFLLAAAHTLRQNAHVRVDVLYGRLGPTGRAWINLLGTVLFLIPFSIGTLFVTSPWVWNSWLTREVSPNPSGLVVYPIKAVILVAFTLLLAQGISEVIKQLAILRRLDPGDARDHSHDLEGGA